MDQQHQTDVTVPLACEVVQPNQKTLKQNQRQSNASFQIHSEPFQFILGKKPHLEEILSHDDYPFAHEASVFDVSSRSLFVTSNQYFKDDPQDGSKQITISRIRDVGGKWTREELDVDVSMANGGVNYGNGILFCAQGSLSDHGGLVLMDTEPPYHTRVLLDNFHGRLFNSLNDVVVHSDGSIWFTDPIYGYEQQIRRQPQLPNQVYRFDPANGDVRAVADGFGRPNGICFSPDEATVYITDTEWIHGDGTTDDTRASSIYAFDVIYRHRSPFLANKRLFAMAAVGIPDGIKCDLEGNVYSGCGDGINVWNAGGILLGKILVPGGVANFCFGQAGEMFLLNEYKVFHATIGEQVRGALLKLRTASQG